MPHHGTITLGSASRKTHCNDADGHECLSAMLCAHALHCVCINAFPVILQHDGSFEFGLLLQFATVSKSFPRSNLQVLAIFCIMFAVNALRTSDSIKLMCGRCGWGCFYMCFVACYHATWAHICLVSINCCSCNCRASTQAHAQAQQLIML